MKGEEKKSTNKNSVLFRKLAPLQRSVKCKKVVCVSLSRGGLTFQCITVFGRADKQLGLGNIIHVLILRHGHETRCLTGILHILMQCFSKHLNVEVFS